MIKPGDPRFYEKERNEKIVALRRQGLELKAIAERYGIRRLTCFENHPER